MTEDNARRDRVIAATMARIAKAPPPFSRSPAVIDIASWAKPALIAASLIIIAASVLLARRREPRAVDDYVAAAIGIPVTFSAYHAAGGVDSWSLVRMRGVGR